MTMVIKRCSEKKDAKKKYMDSEKKLMPEKKSNQK